MRRLALLLIVTVAGCSAGPKADDETSALSRGEKVMAFRADGDVLALIDEEPVAIPAGTSAVVVNDPGEPKDRRVLVNFQAGPSQGKAGTVSRWALRRIND